MVFTILSKCMVHLVTFSYIYHKNQANIGTHTMQYMDSKWVYTQIHPISITKFVRKIGGRGPPEAPEAPPVGGAAFLGKNGGF